MSYRMVVFTGMRRLISLYISIGASGDQALSMSSNIWKGIFFSEQQVPTVGLKYSVDHVVNGWAIIQALLFCL